MAVQVPGEGTACTSGVDLPGNVPHSRGYKYTAFPSCNVVPRKCGEKKTSERDVEEGCGEVLRVEHDKRQLATG